MAPIYLNLFWLAAIYVASLPELPQPAALLLALALSVALWYWRKCSPVIAVLCLLVFALGLLRFDTASAHRSDALAGLASEKVALLRGVVSSEPEIRERHTDFIFAVSAADVDGVWEPVSSSIMVQVPAASSERVYGETLEVQGKLEEPRNFADFDYKSYLARQGIFYQMLYPSVLAHAPPHDDIFAGISSLKSRLTRGLESALPEPQASLAEGILLGIRTSLPPELRAAFASTNTVPILVISGWHVALVAGFLRFLGRRVLRRMPLVVFVLCGIALYTLLVGPQPTVLRASIMAALLLVGEYAGRPSDTIVSLLFAASAMTAFNPSYLGDVGFQLSFAATLGIVLFVPSLQRLLRFLPGWLSDSFSVTMAAELATLPITTIVFGRFSTMGLLANFLTHPATPPIMLLTALTAALALVWAPLARVVAIFDWAILTYVMRVVEFLASLPAAVLPLGQLAPIIAVPYYALLALLLAGRKLVAKAADSLSPAVVSRKTMLVLGPLAMAGVLSWTAFFQVSDRNLRVSFLDVGEGDAILIETAQGQRVLVDGGPSPSALLDALGRRMPFWEHSIDLVVLTNPNEDHIAGLVGVLERFEVGRVMEPRTAYQSASYSHWHNLIRQRSIPTIEAVAGQRIDLHGGATLEVLHPDGYSPSKNPDDSAVVLRLVTDGVAFLLSDDVSANAQRDMALSQPDLSSFLLNVPHHGIRGGLNHSFLNAVDPAVAVISVGKGNPYHYPAPETLAQLQGVQVLRTDLDGTVEVTVRDGQPHVSVAP